ncbi:LURP-one-related/scramblase family protein, partial [Streptomyces griseoincarnatus]
MRLLVRDRILGIGDDYWIEDDRGTKVFLVDGKAMRLRDTFELKDAEGRVLIDIRQKMFALRDTMVIERGGEPLATVRRKRLSLLRNHYRVSLADGGTELDVSGRILDREWGGGDARGHRAAVGPPRRGRPPPPPRAKARADAPPP